MFLEEVEQHGDVGSAMDVLQLVAAELSHNEGVGAEVVEDVEEGDADIAGEDAARQQMVDEARSGGLALGAGDADGEVAVDLQEEVGEGSEVKGER